MAEQPGVIELGTRLRLRAYGGERDVDAAWPWYRDLETVRLVDGEDARPYTRTQVRAMYEVLSAQGEVYMIEESDPSGTWEVIGDVTLAPHTLPIVVRAEAQGRGVGRLVIQSLIERARGLGWAELQVREILPGNARSAAFFRGLGFEPTTSPPPALVLRLHA
ncbi:MAG TPA: GNAT family N-acetyltransferase [Nocardioides sp.]|nr:GNAT family N-acetyltransferase [Nocardioides sp.]